VHGGQDYAQPILLDEAHIARLKDFIPLAPLHQPHNLAGIEAMRAALPGIPQISSFDTAFHRSQPAIAQIFALPRRITAQACVVTASTSCPTNTSPTCCRSICRRKRPMVA
jgi:acetate kinase